MAVREILLLGNPQLHEVSAPISEEEILEVKAVVQDLHDTLMDFRARHNAGRAIAAPQIGVMKRLVYMNIDEPIVLINPIIDVKSVRRLVLWDDCMSFPELFVRVRRHRSCRVVFRDLEWVEHSLLLRDSLSELIQHECDHLDGVLAVSRAIDRQSFALKSQVQLLNVL